MKKCQKNKKTRFALLLKPSLPQKLMKNPINEAKSGFLDFNKKIDLKIFCGKKSKVFITKIRISFDLSKIFF